MIIMIMMTTVKPLITYPSPLMTCLGENGHMAVPAVSSIMGYSSLYNRKT